MPSCRRDSALSATLLTRFQSEEELFPVMKAWLKKHYKLAEDMTFEEYLHMAVEACSKGHFAAGHFRHADITVNTLVGT